MAKYLALLIVLWLSRSVLCENSRVFTLPEICEISTGLRIYVDFGVSGEVRSDGAAEGRVAENPCFFTLVTCPSCSLRLSWAFEGGDGMEKFSIVEPPYNVVDEKTLSDPSRQYVTKTRALSLQFPPESINMTFSLLYESQRNTVVVAEPLGGNLMETSRQIQSPFFPSLYSRDFIVDYNISCLSDDCRIRIIFTDFQLALISTLEIFDSSQERIHIFSGAFFRPPIIFSQDSSIRIRFSANGGSDLGFSANVTFFSATEATNPLLNPNTNCGGSVLSLGGAISMLNMIGEEDDPVFYDCTWIVKPSHRYFHQQDQLLLRVQSFSKMGDFSDLSVHRGSTSTHPRVLKVERPHGNYTDTLGENLIVPLTSGFYVRLRGFFTHESRLVIVYAAFGMRDCYIGTGFMCKNRHCIAIDLRCDGFDQCGDSSDEPTSCLTENASNWNSHGNYFFPKVDTFDDDNLRTVSILLVICSFGSVILITVFLLYRVNSRRMRHQRNLQTHLQTISDLLVDFLPDQNVIPVQEAVADEPPPNYEAPPEYEDVIRVGMEYEIRRSKRRNRSQSKRRRSESRKLFLQEENTPIQADALQQTAEEGILSVASNPEELPGATSSRTLVERLDCVGKLRSSSCEAAEACPEANEAKVMQTILLLCSKSTDK
ncbi:uncharacterized protein LOC132263974 isoform X2 [Phlebotomus argentipes]|uniref:uncharacterized protein LOC132263974 isoform X2 n=1 Tax=Phlebotomus argentipes TaxID=94469 RepID=UPI002892DE0A|nr:uncharacterized protein LOC132263974 isoform X2 [Phlebotomus argentipes]